MHHSATETQRTPIGFDHAPVPLAIDREPQYCRCHDVWEARSRSVRTQMLLFTKGQATTHGALRTGLLGVSVYVRVCAQCATLHAACASASISSMMGSGTD